MPWLPSSDSGSLPRSRSGRPVEPVNPRAGCPGPGKALTLFDSPWKILIVARVIIVLFGSKTLPSAARSLGQSMRILKKEVQGLHEDEPESRLRTLRQRPRHQLGPEPDPHPPHTLLRPACHTTHREPSAAAPWNHGNVTSWCT
jgi:sec-independent protein translocase protein TatA